MAVTTVFACQLLWVRTLKARFSRALCVRPIMGCSTQTLKTDLRDPVYRSRSMWCYVMFDTARSQQSCQTRIKTPACRVETKWFTDIRNESRSRAPSGVLQSWVYLARSLTLHGMCQGNNDDKKRIQWKSCLLTTVSSIERSSVRKMPSSFGKTSINFNSGRQTGRWNSIPRSARYCMLQIRETSSKLPYNIHGHILEETDTAKYRWVNIHHKLSWNHHIQKVTSKANSTRAFLQRNIHQCPHETKVLCYNTRPFYDQLKNMPVSFGIHTPTPTSIYWKWFSADMPGLSFMTTEDPVV